ncbi:hypothetical protein [Endozoicomonas sp. SCSIO W0465]|uniref:hypothetical protein n=1 Tax=Endozoicomonas sp. SCSIO W0465 TaxID=2918516 RepID=UPI002074F169|nr:hypothetical protein [Endozoicomonas sp. SCSIO W0465]USE38777.1 hypothetical protein MJO57_11750 [Endozoicomonas sp. SCSIO W0465]
MLANIVEKWCLRGWYKNQKIPDLCGGAEQLLKLLSCWQACFQSQSFNRDIKVGFRSA